MSAESILRNLAPQALAACAAPGQQSEPIPPIAPMLFCWLKDPGNTDQRRRVIIDATKKLRYVPGVLDLRTGPPLPSDRPIADDSFDVGVYLRFDDKQAIQRYLADPVHRRTVRDALAPRCGRIQAYDFYVP